MPTIKLFIADADPVHILRVRAAVGRRSDMVVAGSATNGRDALRALQSSAVDLLITDTRLPGLDGPLMIRDLTDAKRCPPFIVCTHFCPGLSQDMTLSLGACYVMYKPLEYERLPQLIRACYDSLQPAPRPQAHTRDRGAIIRAQLQALGIPAQLTGSAYLTEAVLLLFESSASLMRNLSKGLYAEVAQRLQTTPARVERSMRTAISTGYMRGCLDQRFRRRPSNRQFIEYLFQSVCDAEAEQSRLPSARPISSR